MNKKTKKIGAMEQQVINLAVPFSVSNYETAVKNVTFGDDIEQAIIKIEDNIEYANYQQAADKAKENSVQA